MSKPKTQHNSAQFRQLFSKIFFPLFLLAAALVSYYYFTQLNWYASKTKSIESANISAQASTLTKEFNNLTADILFLSRLEQVRQLNSSNPYLRQLVSETFYNFIYDHVYYDQIRYLDIQGQEIVRVNQTSSGPIIISEELLQNKADRYYFQDSINLSKNEVFLSPLDLNIEKGEIEQPLKPMLRLATPVYDMNGTKQGIVILNYLAENILSELTTLPASSVTGDVQLLNSQGFWLKSDNPEQNWGFMYSDKMELRMSEVFPNEWNTLMHQEQGQLLTAQGLFTYLRIEPLQSTGIQQDSNLTGAINSNSYYWILLSYIDASSYYSYIRNLQNNSLIILIFITFIIAYASWQFGRMQLNKLINQAEINKLSQAIKQNPQKMMLTGATGLIEYVNPAFESQTGYHESDVIGKSHTLLKSNDSQKEIFKDIWRKVTSGQTWDGRLETKHKDGSTVIEEVHIAPIYDESTITHFISTHDDVTEKVKIEQDLAAYQDRLERLVDERTKQLTETAERAEEANRAKSTFLANMSHEIRTPINAIIGHSEILKRDNLDPNHQPRLDKVRTSARHLLQLINDILDFSKIEAGKLTLEKTPFSLRHIINGVLSLVEGQAHEKGVKVISRLNDAPDYLSGDPTRLSQAILNLTSNAIKFSVDGEITIHVRVQEQTDTDCKLKIVIEDQGIGIEKEQLNTIFIPFEQADSSITRKYGGTGLGLVITQSLVKLMGGEIGVESEVGIGSSFWFTSTFDLVSGDLVEQVETGNSLEEDHQIHEDHTDCKILVVEDNPLNLEVVVDLLEPSNLTVDSAENGLLALEKLEHGSYDLILMDMQMPELDGLETTRIIRESSGTLASPEDIPIVAMTANVFKEDVDACMAAGMDDFLKKPIEIKKFFSTLNRWLSNEERFIQPSPELLVTDQQQSADETSNDTDPTVVIDRAALVSLFGDNPDKHQSFLVKFADQAQTICSEIQTAYEEKNLKDIAFLAHKLKSTSKAVGANILSDICYQLEMAGKNNDWNAVEKYHPQMLPAVKDVAEYTEKL